MATGTSPLTGAICGRHFARWWPRGGQGAEAESWIGRRIAGLHLAVLAATITMGWHDPAGASGGMGGLAALQLTFLATTGAAAAFLALRRPEEPASVAGDEPGDRGVSELLSQMSHELRTPLNAMIGFSEVMLRELHGPLGHARYQEYVSHINESGGRLLKASEDTLAVTATMSALMANRSSTRRQRVLAITLLQKAWSTAAGEGTGLSVTNCNNCEIECERRATEQALEHLLREATLRLQPGGRVEAKGRRRGGARSIELRVAAEPATAGRDPGLPSMRPEREREAYAPGGSLRVILARLLLEMQGATLSLWEDEHGWAACVAFPPRP